MFSSRLCTVLQGSLCAAVSTLEEFHSREEMTPSFTLSVAREEALSSALRAALRGLHTLSSQPDFSSTAVLGGLRTRPRAALLACARACLTALAAYAHHAAKLQIHELTNSLALASGQDLANRSCAVTDVVRHRLFLYRRERQRLPGALTRWAVMLMDEEGLDETELRRQITIATQT